MLTAWLKPMPHPKQTIRPAAQSTYSAAGSNLCRLPAVFSIFSTECRTVVWCFAAKLPADLRERGLGQVFGQVHGDLPRDRRWRANCFWL